MAEGVQPSAKDIGVRAESPPKAGRVDASVTPHPRREEGIARQLARQAENAGEGQVDTGDAGDNAGKPESKSKIGKVIDRLKSAINKGLNKGFEEGLADATLKTLGSDRFTTLAANDNSESAKPDTANKSKITETADIATNTSKTPEAAVVDNPADLATKMAKVGGEDLSSVNESKAVGGEPGKDQVKIDGEDPAAFLRKLGKEDPEAHKILTGEKPYHQIIDDVDKFGGQAGHASEEAATPPKTEIELAYDALSDTRRAFVEEGYGMKGMGKRILGSEALSEKRAKYDEALNKVIALKSEQVREEITNNPDNEEALVKGFITEFKVDEFVKLKTDERDIYDNRLAEGGVVEKITNPINKAIDAYKGFIARASHRMVEQAGLDTLAKEDSWKATKYAALAPQIAAAGALGFTLNMGAKIGTLGIARIPLAVMAARGYTEAGERGADWLRKRRNTKEINTAMESFKDESTGSYSMDKAKEYMNDNQDASTEYTKHKFYSLGRKAVAVIGAATFAYTGFHGSEAHAAEPGPGKVLPPESGAGTAKPEGVDSVRPINVDTTGDAKPIKPEGADTVKPIKVDTAGDAHPIKPESMDSVKPIKVDATGDAHPIKPESMDSVKPIKVDATGDAHPITPEKSGAELTDKQIKAELGRLIQQTKEQLEATKHALAEPGGGNADQVHAQTIPNEKLIQHNQQRITELKALLEKRGHSVAAVSGPVLPSEGAGKGVPLAGEFEAQTKAEFPKQELKLPSETAADTTPAVSAEPAKGFFGRMGDSISKGWHYLENLGSESDTPAADAKGGAEQAAGVKVPEAPDAGHKTVIHHLGEKQHSLTKFFKDYALSKDSSLSNNPNALNNIAENAIHHFTPAELAKYFPDGVNEIPQNQEIPVDEAAFKNFIDHAKNGTPLEHHQGGAGAPAEPQSKGGGPREAGAKGADHHRGHGGGDAEVKKKMDDFKNLAVRKFGADGLKQIDETTGHSETDAEYHKRILKLAGEQGVKLEEADYSNEAIFGKVTGPSQAELKAQEALDVVEIQTKGVKIEPAAAGETAQSPRAAGEAPLTEKDLADIKRVYERENPGTKVLAQKDLGPARDPRVAEATGSDYGEPTAGINPDTGKPGHAVEQAKYSTEHAKAAASDNIKNYYDNLPANERAMIDNTVKQNHFYVYEHASHMPGMTKEQLASLTKTLDGTYVTYILAHSQDSPEMGRVAGAINNIIAGDSGFMKDRAKPFYGENLNAFLFRISIEEHNAGMESHSGKGEPPANILTKEGKGVEIWN